MFEIISKLQVTTSDCKDIGFNNLEFVTTNLCQFYQFFINSYFTLCFYLFLNENDVNENL